MASGSSPAAVFNKMGLRLRGPWPFPRGAHQSSGLPAAARFRDALEELGGLFSTFGQYLSFRADLVRTDYLATLRRVKCEIPFLPREEAVRTLVATLGIEGERLAANLEDPPLWSTIARCAWRSTWEGRPVVVQVARPPVSKAEWERFEHGVKNLREPGIAPALHSEVLRQYRLWLGISDSPSRERAYLQTLSAFPMETMVKYPDILPDLCGGDITCWRFVEGEPVDRLLADAKPGVMQRLAEALLEQICLIAVVDADWDLSAIVLTQEGKLALRRANRLVSIPAAMARTTLKYVTAVLAGNSQYANRQLVRMVSGNPSPHMEARLFDELSNLEPELKINLRFPPSVGAFESNWRAMSRIVRERPMYLDAMHRNLLSVGYHDAEAAPRGVTPDAVMEAHWPVLGRLLRSRMAEFTSGDIISQWVMGSGLLTLESMRQATRMAEGFRDDDLTFSFAPALSEDAARGANRAIRTGAVLAILLMIFLVCLRWGPSTPAPWSGFATLLGVLAAAGLLWVLARIG